MRTRRIETTLELLTLPPGQCVHINGDVTLRRHAACAARADPVPYTFFVVARPEFNYILCDVCHQPTRDYRESYR